MSRRGDTGLGLVEVLVSMTLLAIALSVFGVAFSAMLRTSESSQDVGAVTDQTRLALNELDRQVRSGYWVKPTTIPGASSAITVLTVNRDGAKRCWIWALDTLNGRLMSFNYSPGGSVPALASFGAVGGNRWHIAAGPEGDPAESRRVIVSGSLAATSPVQALNGSSFQRADYWLTAVADLIISKSAFAGRPAVSVPLKFSVSVRNQWAGAPFAGVC